MQVPKNWLKNIIRTAGEKTETYKNECSHNIVLLIELVIKQTAATIFTSGKADNEIYAIY
jgi:hypothetical protein